MLALALGSALTYCLGLHSGALSMPVSSVSLTQSQRLLGLLQILGQVSGETKTEEVPAFQEVSILGEKHNRMQMATVLTFCRRWLLSERKAGSAGSERGAQGGCLQQVISG